MHKFKSQSIELFNKDMPEDYKSNGCGSGWNAKIIPNTIYGLDITECCRYHDFLYSTLLTIKGKDKADRIFLNNMLRVIEAKKSWWFPHSLARRRALKYYESVVNFGGTAYWKGKNK